MVKNLHTIDELCEKCRISKGMVHKLRRAGMPHITIGRCIRYSMEDVDAWIAENQADQKTEGISTASIREKHRKSPAKTTSKETTI